MWPDFAVLAERFRVVLTAKEAESRHEEAEIVANVAKVAKRGGGDSQRDEDSSDDLMGMSGNFRRAGGRDGVPAGVICNNCLENHFLSACP